MIDLNDDTIDPNKFDEDDRATTTLLGKKWSDCEFASFENIVAIAEGKQAKFFVWPDEGEFEGKHFRFNKKHEGFEPLIVDIQTAAAMTTVHNAFEKVENREKMTTWVAKGRGHFAVMADFAWKHVRVSFSRQ